MAYRVELKPPIHPRGSWSVFAMKDGFVLRQKVSGLQDERRARIVAEAYAAKYGGAPIIEYRR